MEKVVLKRNPLFFYGFYFLVAFFGLVLATVMSILPFLMSKYQDTEAKYFFVVLGTALAGLMIYLLYQAFRQTPLVTITSKNISFRLKTYMIEEISSVIYNGKQPFKHSYSLEGMRITFSDGYILCLYDDLYTNLHRLKQLLATAKHSIQFTTPSHEPILGVFDDKTYMYKGSVFWNFRGILFIVVSTFFILAAVNYEYNPVKIIIAIGVISIYYIAVGFNMYYFELDKDYFIVRNHLFFWTRKAYPNSDILEIVYEPARSKLPYRLRLVRQDFSSKLYFAYTLSDRKWLAMKQKLESHNIYVRIECNYLKSLL